MVKLILQRELFEIQTCFVAIPKTQGWINLTKLLEAEGISPEDLWPVFSQDPQTSGSVPRDGFTGFPAIQLHDEQMIALAHVLSKVIRVVVHESGGYLHILTATPSGDVYRYQP